MRFGESVAEREARGRGRGCAQRRRERKAWLLSMFGDGTYEAHRRVCGVCAKDGVSTGEDCVAGNALATAWGWTEDHRDRVRGLLK